MDAERSARATATASGRCSTRGRARRATSRAGSEAAAGSNTTPRASKSFRDRATRHSERERFTTSASRRATRRASPTCGRCIRSFPAERSRRASGSCTGPTVIPDFDPVTTQTVQPTALFGAGWIDLISDRAILRNARNRGLRAAAREMSLEFDNIPVGRVRRVEGGVGKFGWKAQFANLDEFVAAACANELGLGTPLTEQAKPLAAPDYSAGPDLDKKQFRSLVAFVKTLPKPVEVGAQTRRTARSYSSRSAARSVTSRIWAA